jgi:hypothetical protein
VRKHFIEKTPTKVGDLGEKSKHSGVFSFRIDTNHLLTRSFDLVLRLKSHVHCTVRSVSRFSISLQFIVGLETPMFVFFHTKLLGVTFDKNWASRPSRWYHVSTRQY